MKSLLASVLLASVLATTSAGVYSEPTPAVDSAGSVYQLESRWTTDAGRTLKLAELGGHYQVVAFIFTHCGGACPLLVKSLQLQARSMPQQMRERARFLLVSIDPANDTVAALRRYRQDMGLDERWTVLRGRDTDVRELTAALGFNYQRMADGQFAHSNSITLLDPAGAIVLQHPQAEGALQAMSETVGFAQ
jgi:protein SCO1